MGTGLTTCTQTPSSMNTWVIACSLLASAAAGPLLVNVNGVFLPQHHSSSPYPTAYGYAAGPQHPIHHQQVAVAPAVVAVKVVEVAPVAAVKAVLAAAIPAVHAVHAVHTVAPAVPSITSSQYHAQDEAGNYHYGYRNIHSAKEVAGNVHEHYEAGYYTDLDSDRTVQYVADSSGFREV